MLWTTDSVRIKKENLCRYSVARINICIRNTDFAGFRIFQVIYVCGVMKWHLGPHIAGRFIQVSVFFRVRINRFHCMLEYKVVKINLYIIQINFNHLMFSSEILQSLYYSITTAHSSFKHLIHWCHTHL